MDIVAVDPGKENALIARVKLDHPEGRVPAAFKSYHFSLSDQLVFDEKNGHWLLAINTHVDLGPRLPRWARTCCEKNCRLDDLVAEGVDPQYVRACHKELEDVSGRAVRAYQSWISHSRPEGFRATELEDAAARIGDVRVIQTLSGFFELEKRDNDDNSYCSGGAMAGTLCDVSRRLGLLLDCLTKRLAELSQPSDPAQSPLAETEFHFPPDRSEP